MIARTADTIIRGIRGVRGDLPYSDEEIQQALKMASFSLEAWEAVVNDISNQILESESSFAFNQGMAHALDIIKYHQVNLQDQIGDIEDGS